MPRWTLILLLVAAIVCASAGASLTAAFTPFSAASFGWTAYSPLSSTAYSAGFTPINTTWLMWAPRIGVALVALGAGTSGAVIVALLGQRQRRSVARPHPTSPKND